MLVHVGVDGQQTTEHFVVAKADGSNPRPLDPSMEGLHWSADGRWLLGVAGVGTDPRGLASTIVALDPEGRVAPVEIDAAGLLGMSWRPDD